MATHTNHLEKEAFYFVTFTCYKWLPLLEESAIYDYLPGWFQNLKNNGCVTCGFVIMPNHIHLVVHILNTSQGLNAVMINAKRFLAYEVVKGLKKLGKTALLQIMINGVQENEKIKGKKHQVFRLSFDARKLDSVEEINNVLDYIHFNPVSGKWSLCSVFTEFPYSSASFYEDGVHAKLTCEDYRQFFM